MTEFNFNAKNYKMTDKWNELTFGQWYKLQNLIQRSEFVQLPPLIESIEIISILTNTEDDSLDEMPYQLHLELAEIQKEIVSDLHNFDDQKWKVVKENNYNVNNRTYSYNSTGNFTAAEMNDVIYYAQQAEKGLISNQDLLLKTASTLIRPATEEETEMGTKYWKLLKKNMLDTNKIESDILEMNCLWVSSVVNFFFDGETNKSKTSPLYSVKR